MKSNVFDLYYIDLNYLKFLHSIDSEVYYSEKYLKNKKPFLGIIMILNKDINFFIPFSSPKDKHKKFPQRSNSYVLMKDKSGYALGLLDIRKMIPVRSDLYEKVDFSKIKERGYKVLLSKQLKFCNENFDSIKIKSQITYKKQTEREKTLKYHCNYKKLENDMKNYKN
ncbi:type III toxin-antitoxin system ToxN/AbiQ family toxin [Mycoplasma sp. Ms02]|uniref:type III toxin-antitoxin system ToxN/AbiQ family toxin n=1 Tax=Mycoplasma sp. Ms02 TaxID=353851 RepID=UPI001C8A7205|nr:type III toxin-antitoxin system ToxN/AbiQ family toxin [Mycoplasma sp. Ms02]QZE12538.1 type III toxin-antitoxin system ToxN/AbiQ family toxin [Mycoplasma sp. Ms02]